MLLKHRKAAKRTITFLVVGLVFAISAPGASANSAGRCASHHVNTGQELFESWKAEGVTSLAVPIVHSSTGFRIVDGDLHSFMDERVVKMKLAEEATFVDYGCHPGEIFGAGTITFAKGTTIMGALPNNYEKSDYCGIKAHKGCERVATTACSVGKVNCSNPLENCAKMVFYVKKEHSRKPRHHHHHHHGKHHQKNGPICSQNSSNGTSCGGGPCSSTTIIVGSGDTVSGSSVTCKTEEPAKPPCGCTPEPPKPPCGCTPEEPEEPEKPKPEPPKVEWERIQEVYVNGTRNLCVTATPTSVVGEVQFGVKDGERSNGGKGVYNASTNKFCVTYTAPSEEPSHVCEEEISAKLPPGTKCDIAHVAVFCTNGAKTVESKMEIAILDAEKNEEVIW